MLYFWEMLTFTCHHGPGFKALLTVALEASHHISAGAVPTGVPDGALISVWAGGEREGREEEEEGRRGGRKENSSKERRKSGTAGTKC